MASSFGRSVDASGPKMLQLAGEVADGVIINTGVTPEIVRDSITQVRLGAERALDDVDMWGLPLTNVRDDRAVAVDEVAMTLASAGSHLSRFGTAGKHVPPISSDCSRTSGLTMRIRRLHRRRRVPASQSTTT